MMSTDYVTVRELREKSGEIWDRVEAGEEFIVTRNGKPFALLVHTEPQGVEQRLRALRLSRLGELVQAVQSSALQSGAARFSEDDIEAEIKAARRASRVKRSKGAGAATLTLQEPGPKPYARRR